MEHLPTRKSFPPRPPQDGYLLLAFDSLFGKSLRSLCTPQLGRNKKTVFITVHRKDSAGGD